MNHEFMNLTHNVDGGNMKKKKLIALLLFSTMLLTSCGQKNTSEETENTEFREEAVAESTTEDTSTQVEVVTEPEDTDRTEYWLEEQSNVSVCLDREQDNYVIVDGEQEIPFQLDGHPLTPLEIVGAYKMDVDGDQKEEYAVTFCDGRGTGIYLMGLAVIEEGNEQPVFYLSSDDIAENIDGRITYKYDAKYRMLSIYTGNEKNEEPAWQVCLQTEEEECGGRFENTDFGSHVYIEYKEGEFWIHGTLPLFFQGRAVEYGPTPGVSAPLIFSKGYEYSIGKIGVQAPYENAECGKPIAYSEVLAQFSADITHDGQKNTILLTVPEGATLQDVMDGRTAFGQFYVSAEQHYLAEEGEGDFSEIYAFVNREFSPTHVGNGQMFVTTVEGKDYLIQTNFWSGMDTLTYQYEVFFEDRNAKYEVESAKIEMGESSSKEDISEFFSNLNTWVNDSTYVVYVADIDYEPNLFYSTEDHKISPAEYLTEKEKQWLEALESL